MNWLLGGAIAAAVCALLYRWIRRLLRRRKHRLISFVALLREPMTMDPAILANAAGKVWGADLGDGTSPGADGFVVGADMVNTITHEGRMFLVNSFARPYIDDVEQAAEGIPDLRIRGLFCEHSAWFSCDALGINGDTPEQDVVDWYQRLGKLFAELLDENCLLIFIPDSGRAYPVNEETIDALGAEDPLGALQATATVPIIEVGDDDPLMQQAVEQARRNWPQFVAAFETRAGEHFSVKAPVSHAGNKEFIWISVTALEGDRVYGTLANDPGNLGPLKLGSKVVVPVGDLNDWCYIDAQENMAGGFTLEAINQAARRKPRKGSAGAP